MTIDEARAHVGEDVIYSTRPGEAEAGTIIRVGDLYAYVLYGRSLTPQATIPECLTLMRGGSVMEHFRLELTEAGIPLAGPEDWA